MKNLKKQSKKERRANYLSGSDWTKYSISVWNDIRKSPDETKLKHPALFPAMLVERLISCFTVDQDKVILDPFSGSSSTIVGAVNLNKKGIGFELSEEYIALSEERLSQLSIFKKYNYEFYQKDSRNLSKYLDKESVDLVITSPPYWDILKEKRTADHKEVRSYGEDKKDLGNIRHYETFLDELAKVFFEVYKVLKPNKYCLVIVMDLRKKNKFYPLHIDLTRKMENIGFELDDIIIWDRKSEYNNLRTLGYPYVFRINKIHEFILIFRK